MEWLAKFFTLRWKLPHWVIPLIWTAYLVQHIYGVFKPAYTTLRNFNFQLPREAILYVPLYLLSEILQIALVGVILFAVQRMLFGNKT